MPHQIMGSKNAILQTLCYSDIFEYPLAKDQVWEQLTTEQSITKPILEKTLDELVKTKKIHKRDGYYFLPGKEEIVALRKKRALASIQKLRKAKRIARLLGKLPTIQLLGISGGLAMENADADDDIDFFIITAPKTLWLTRLLVLLVLQSLGVRRKRNAKKVANTICANMFLDSTSLAFSKQQQTLYQGHEIMHMIPLIDRQDTYKNFLGENQWIQHYLPNAREKEVFKQYKQHTMLIKFFAFFERIARQLQIHSIKKNQTLEMVTDHQLWFHPMDYEVHVTGEYNTRKKYYEI